MQIFFWYFYFSAYSLSDEFQKSFGHVNKDQTFILRLRKAQKDPERQRKAQKGPLKPSKAQEGPGRPWKDK